MPFSKEEFDRNLVSVVEHPSRHPRADLFHAEIRNVRTREQIAFCNRRAHVRTGESVHKTCIINTVPASLALACVRHPRRDGAQEAFGSILQLYLYRRPERTEDPSFVPTGWSSFVGGAANGWLSLRPELCRRIRSLRESSIRIHGSYDASLSPRIDLKLEKEE